MAFRTASDVWDVVNVSMTTFSGKAGVPPADSLFAVNTTKRTAPLSFRPTTLSLLLARRTFSLLGTACETIYLDIVASGDVMLWLNDQLIFAVGVIDWFNPRPMASVGDLVRTRVPVSRWQLVGYQSASSVNVLKALVGGMASFGFDVVVNATGCPPCVGGCATASLVEHYLTPAQAWFYESQPAPAALRSPLTLADAYTSKSATSGLTVGKLADASAPTSSAMHFITTLSSIRTADCPVVRVVAHVVDYFALAAGGQLLACGPTPAQLVCVNNVPSVVAASTSIRFNYTFDVVPKPNEVLVAIVCLSSR